MGVKPLLFHPRALLRVPGTSQGAELQTHRATPVGFPSWHPTLCVFKYRASRPLGEYLNPRGMPGILKRFYNIFLPSKLSWLLASAVKSSFSAVSCHLHAEGG